jgi:hypothetical protein
LSISGILERELIMTGLSVVFSTVQAVFLVIFRSKAAEEAPFFSYIVLSTSVRLLLRGAMPEDRPNSNVHEKLGGKKC